MRYRKFGNTGLFISELCLGTMTFGGGTGGIWDNIGDLQQAEADKLIGRSLDAGINFIDTADIPISDIYSDGKSEIITGQALKNLKVPREDVVVATEIFGETGTKGDQFARRVALSHHRRREGEPQAVATRPRRSLPDSRLRSGHADRGNSARTRQPGAARPCALHRRIELGRVADHGGARHFGAARARALRFESWQAYYTIAGRDLEREIVPLLNSENVGLMVWSPFTSGLLSGKFTREGGKEEGGSEKLARYIHRHGAQAGMARRALLLVDDAHAAQA